jgi:hypothetical protein
VNDDEKMVLVALEKLLDLTDSTDWPLVHAAVRNDISAGRYGREFEAAYGAMVGEKLAMRDASP